MDFITIQATLDGKAFQDIFPLIEKDINVKESQLYQIAKILKEDIDNNLQTGKDYFGNAVQPLAPSTVARKGHGRVFYEYGDLFKSILYQKISSSEFEVYVANSRDLILSYLQQGNKSNNLPKREPFGISKNAENKIDKVLGN